MARLVQYENRNLVRHELVYYLKVNDRLTRRELGRLGDIHLEGMLLFTPEPLPAETVYDLLLELPKALAATEGYAELPLRAQAIWNRPGPKLCNYYENGLRFMRLTRKARQTIRHLTEIFAMPGRDPK
jgi:hypothetical protein